jgi:hypothetical protein
MTTSKLTRVILLSCIAVCVIWDVFVAWNPIPDDTISEMTLKFVMNNPTIPFLVGYVCGHLFWAQTPKKEA